ncbi:tRNA glutamyl-Q(34) synthetase GluQRS [Acuticoccus sp. M5D2P5]|uniref:tRNA glutamyl-Q(34) synthetase GluQRS n=1 Tax=Acuticoccus kalidii TaxID=2910977 RepID=UPI001F3257BA|nr:tRNA glutamyl-Q(34) synthetase GluQRS [Acuticoccus kalidii]MCF3932244.1 tRNA glutamyl-Q(34) synthetase GluQRS [Acuticoccus kalidii]
MLRFAPSPNGLLHLGHALSAIANERMAEAVGRPLTLRIEDIDQTRARPHFEAAIIADLAWLGVDWTPPMRRQSEHFAAYRDALERLKARGLVYPTFASRREFAEVARMTGLARDPDGAPLFPGDAAILGAREAARRLAEAEPAAWRLDMTRALADLPPLTWTETDAAGGAARTIGSEPAAWGDVILARKDVPTSYHLSVVVDDAVQGISHVVRGMDLYPSTSVHRVLQTLLGLPAPLYYHHPLILGEDGRKLSKSNGAESLAALREAGATRAAVRARVAARLAEPS